VSRFQANIVANALIFTAFRLKVCTACSCYSAKPHTNYKEHKDLVCQKCCCLLT